MAKGKYSAQCVDLASAANALATIAKAVGEGTFDDQMKAIAGEVKTKAV
jgi:hypothetical protein